MLDKLKKVWYSAPEVLLRAFRATWSYMLRIGRALDKLLNTILLGDPDEYLSERWGRQRHTCGFCDLMCSLLHKIDKGHCDKYERRD